MKKIISHIYIFGICLLTIFFIVGCKKNKTAKQIIPYYKIDYVSTEGGIVYGEKTQSIEEYRDTTEVIAMAKEG